MSTRDVPPDDMPNDKLSADELEALLAGSSPAHSGDPVATFISEARSAFSAIEAPPTSGPLAEYLDVGQVALPSSTGAGAAAPAPAASSDSSPRRSKVFTSLGAVIGTTAGKVLLGTSAAIAATAGAQASGFIDINGPAPVEIAAVSDSSTSTLDTTSTIQVTTTVDVPTTTIDGTDSSSSSTSTSSSSSTSVPAGATTTPFTVPIDGIGTVTIVAGPPLRIQNVSAPGYDVFIETSDHPEIDLRGDEEIEVDVEWEDGLIRVRVRWESNDAEIRNYYTAAGELVDQDIRSEDDDHDDHDDHDDDDESDDHDEDHDEDDDEDDESDDDHDEDDESDDEDSDDESDDDHDEDDDD